MVEIPEEKFLYSAPYQKRYERVSSERMPNEELKCEQKNKKNSNEWVGFKRYNLLIIEISWIKGL